MGKKTPLYEQHITNKAQLVDSAGFLMPGQYKGLITEHTAVRRAAGLFDLSHMSEFHLKGPDAVENLNRLLTNNFDGLSPGKARYSPMCYETGGTIGDFIVYRFCINSFFIVGNAHTQKRDYNYLNKNISGDVFLMDISQTTAKLALHGPLARKVLQRFTTELLPTIYHSFIEGLILCGVRCLVSRTDYTGEDGYELYCRAVDVVRLYNSIAAEPEVTLCGIASSNSLRIEAGTPLYGHELTNDITPLECGLDFAVNLNKPNFIGKDALLNGSNRFRIGLKLLQQRKIKPGDKVYIKGKEVGFITSGSYCPTLEGAYAMAIVDTDLQDCDVASQGTLIAAKRCELPFYSKM